MLVISMNKEYIELEKLIDALTAMKSNDDRITNVSATINGYIGVERHLYLIEEAEKNNTKKSAILREAIDLYKECH